MRSRHVDEFNHDPWAQDYDRNVRNEEDPIRTGYAQTLAWTVAQAQIGPDSVVLDLGSGTGNTSALIPAARQVICVDISQNMTALARPKLAHLARVDFVQADLLEYFVRHPSTQTAYFDAVISTYAVHHLTEGEKATLFSRVFAALKPGGRAVFGDLMFRNAAAETELRAFYAAAGMTDLILDFDEEFFWNTETAVAALAEAGLAVEDVQRFSALSWGISVTKPPATF